MQLALQLHLERLQAIGLDGLLRFGRKSHLQQANAKQRDWMGGMAMYAHPRPSTASCAQHKNETTGPTHNEHISRTCSARHKI